MLDKSNGGAFARSQAITGYALALSRATPTERAIVAARLHLGVNRPLVHAAIAVLKSGDHPDLLRAVLTGRLTLLEAAVLAQHPQKNLIETFAAAPAAERLELGRVAGVDEIFDAHPLLSQALANAASRRLGGPQSE